MVALSLSGALCCALAACSGDDPTLGAPAVIDGGADGTSRGEGGEPRLTDDGGPAQGGDAKTDASDAAAVDASGGDAATLDASGGDATVDAGSADAATVDASADVSSASDAAGADAGASGWVQVLASASLDAIDVDSRDNLVLVSTEFTDRVALRVWSIDRAGRLRWEHTLPFVGTTAANLSTSYHRGVGGVGVAVDRRDGDRIYVTATSSGQLRTATASFSTSGQQVLVLALDSEGKERWARQYGEGVDSVGSPNTLNAAGAIAARAGAVYVGSQMQGSFTLGGQSQTIWSVEGVVAAFKADGAFTWLHKPAAKTPRTLSIVEETSAPCIGESGGYVGAFCVNPADPSATPTNDWRKEYALSVRDVRTTGQALRVLTDEYRFSAVEWWDLDPATGSNLRADSILASSGRIFPVAMASDRQQRTYSLVQFDGTIEPGTGLPLQASGGGAIVVVHDAAGQRRTLKQLDLPPTASLLDSTTRPLLAVLGDGSFVVGARPERGSTVNGTGIPDKAFYLVHIPAP